MCGYVQRDNHNRHLRRVLERIELGDLFEVFQGGPPLEQFYPAFGKNPAARIRGLIVNDGGELRAVNATWWFDCEAEGDHLVVGDRTTFNARNLNSPFWKGAVRHHRGIVLATGLGESKVIAGRKRQFLMESEQPFLLGALYRKFPNGLYSCAIITRDEHPKFTPYHDKAFPLFLPAEKKFVETWLADDPDSLTVQDLLERPRLHADLTVTPVKTFKSGAPTGPSERLQRD